MSNNVQAIFLRNIGGSRATGDRATHNTMKHAITSLITRYVGETFTVNRGYSYVCHFSDNKKPLLILKVNKMKLLIIIVAVMVMTGCVGATGDIGSTSDIVRGCSYIASAIVTHGILQIIFRK
jgi:hypothetical protein